MSDERTASDSARTAGGASSPTVRGDVTPRTSAAGCGRSIGAYGRSGHVSALHLAITASARLSSGQRGALRESIRSIYVMLIAISGGAALLD